MELIVEISNDGSHTLFVPELNERYHSVYGAINESNHVYIKSGLKHILKSDISVLEIGFGTGLNAYLTLLYSNTNKCKISYSAIELYPLELDLIMQLNYPECLHADKELFLQLHQNEWNKKVKMNDFFTINKINTDVITYSFSEKADLVYFDAFGPEKQPEIWQENVLKKIVELLNPNGIFVTYSAKGIIKRLLKRLTLKVETIPGPKGKREMIRAIKVI